MNQNRIIKITCDAATTMPIDELEAFQGKLKSITKAEFEKLKSAILKYGFSFPVFVWKKHILDGHQRVQAVKRLIDDGYELEGGMLPVALIEAKDRKEAAEKLLLINSRYATIDQDGFDWFVQDFDIDVVDMSGLLEIPEIDFSFEDERDKDEEFIEKEEISFQINEPEHIVEIGDKYLIDDRHMLICSGIIKDWNNWKDYLDGDDTLFIPYPSIYILQSEKINDHKLLIVQPDKFIIGKMLDIYCELNGEDSIKKI